MALGVGQTLDDGGQFPTAAAAGGGVGGVVAPRIFSYACLTAAHTHIFGIAA